MRFILDTINYCLNEGVISKVGILNYLYKNSKTTELRDAFFRKFIHLDSVSFYKKLEKYNVYFEKTFLAKLSIYEAVEYIIHEGANLISYPFEIGQSIEDALPDEIHQSIWAIFGQNMSAMNINGNWMGSLNSFEG